MWEDRLEELLTFRRTHGHVNVPRRWPNNRPLAHWVVNQRRLIRTGRLSPERLRRLQELDIRWPSAEQRTQVQDREWDRMFDALAAYRREHGDTDVPAAWPANPKLGRWVVGQRFLLREGSLRDDRRRRLQELGLDLGRAVGHSRARDAAWDRMFDALAAYRKAHGNCNVPKNWPSDPKLARWVSRLRHQLKRRPIRPDRWARLVELGVTRTERPERAHVVLERRRDRAWRAMLDALVAFRTEHGHCDVPRRWAPSPKLGRWVAAQRGLRRDGRLSAERLHLLTELGFQWHSVRHEPLVTR